MSNEAITLKSPESRDGAFRFYIEKGINFALAKIKERFEDAAEEKDRLPFHNSRHTKEVIRRTRKILSILQEYGLVKERDVAIGGLAAAFHDAVQKWTENKIEDDSQIKVMRKRFAGENEKNSAEEAVAYVDEAIRESGDPNLFMEDDKAVLREAMDVTIPGFDAKNGTVVQPNLNERSSFIARAVALGDLGTAGMDGPEAFLYEGDALFREENLDILDAMKNLRAISDNQKEYYRQRMLRWSGFQAVFGAGRKNLLSSELTAFPHPAREKVEAEFDKFDLSIEQAKEAAKRREKMTFEELAKDMGYAMT